MVGFFKNIGTLPFLMAVFLNTLVDLGHKIVIQNTIFKVYDGSEQIFLTAIVNGLILLPFILLFSTAGFVADKYPKSSVMRLAAWFAVILTIGITISYALGWFWVAFAMTFLPWSLMRTDHILVMSNSVSTSKLDEFVAPTTIYSFAFPEAMPKASTPN